MNPSYIYAPVAIRFVGDAQISDPVMIQVDTVAYIYPLFSDSIKGYDTIFVDTEIKKAYKLNFYHHFEHNSYREFGASMNYSRLGTDDGSWTAGSFSLNKERYNKGGKP